MERWQEQAATMRHNAKVSSLAISSEESPQVQVLVHADCHAAAAASCVRKDMHPKNCQRHAKSLQLPLSMCTAMH